MLDHVLKFRISRTFVIPVLFANVSANPKLKWSESEHETMCSRLNVLPNCKGELWSLDLRDKHTFLKRVGLKYVQQYESVSKDRFCEIYCSDSGFEVELTPRLN